MPTFWLLNNDLPGALQQKNGGESGSLWLDIKQAYTIPTKFVGGFPRLALGSFLFMAGTAPIFFLFLIIRDLVGIIDPAELQSVLAETSIIFFLIAGISAASTGGGGAQSRQRSMSGTLTLDAEAALELEKRDKINAMFTTMAACALLTLVIPSVRLWSSVSHRMIVFTVIVCLLGVCCGQAYARFQDLTWRLLPKEKIDISNAMGYSVMLRNAGTGVGNFISGLVLNFFLAEDTQEAIWQQGHDFRRGMQHVGIVGKIHSSLVGSDQPIGEVQYSPLGYSVVCVMCTCVLLAGCSAVHSIPKLIEREQREEQQGDTGGSFFDGKS